MEDVIIQEYEKYKQYVFKSGYIKEDSFTLQSFIQYLKNKRKSELRIDEKIWFEIKTNYNGIWI